MRTRPVGLMHLGTLGTVTAISLAACAGDPHPQPGGPGTIATVAIAPEKLLPAPATDPEELAGVDTSDLTPRERKAYWRWVSQLYAPCTDVAVSIAECVKEQRACAACVPAASFLASRARSGLSENEVFASYQTRFGEDVKKVDAGDSPARGPANAPVTIVVWSDFECPACGFAVPYLDGILEKHANDVRLVHKLYPLKAHPHSRAAARASIAARRQGKYWEMEKELFSHQKHLEDSDLEEYARNIGLDMARYARDFADPKAEDIIDKDRAEAEKQGLAGTPFILINGREFDLAFFRVDKDLEPWIDTEVEIVKKDGEHRAIAAVKDTLSGKDKGPVAPLTTASPAPSAAPSAAPAATKP